MANLNSNAHSLLDYLEKKITEGLSNGVIKIYT